MTTLHDSGERREFDSGAVRDMQEGKGRCDLLPACALLRLSRHYEAGAAKYEPRNWEKGMPVSVMIDSGIRHILKYLDGWTDEDHLCAAAWNILGAMWMEEKRPDLIDIPARMRGDSNGHERTGKSRNKVSVRRQDKKILCPSGVSECFVHRKY